MSRGAKQSVTGEFRSDGAECNQPRRSEDRNGSDAITKVDFKSLSGGRGQVMDGRWVAVVGSSVGVMAVLGRCWSRAEHKTINKPAGVVRAPTGDAAAPLWTGAVDDGSWTMAVYVGVVVGGSLFWPWPWP